MVDVITNAEMVERGKCADCVWFKRSGNIGGSGECRAAPPVPLIVPIRSLVHGDSLSIQSVFPSTTQDTFCGCFESDEQAIH